VTHLTNFARPRIPSRPPVVQATIDSG